MGKLPQGLLGMFIGRAGPVTGFIRNGQPLVRISRNSSAPKKTPARLAQQGKLTVANNFTRAFTQSGFLNKSFPAYGHTGSGYNRATSAILNRAISGEHPNLYIAYPLALVSQGPLPVAEEVGSLPDAEGNIQFYWADNSDTGTAKASDKVILVAYFPELKKAVYTIGDATRKEGRATLETKDYNGYTAETWVGFLSSNEKNASDSVYAGRVELSRATD